MLDRTKAARSQKPFDGLIIDDLSYLQQSRDDMEVVFTLLAERGSILMTRMASVNSR